MAQQTKLGKLATTVSRDDDGFYRVVFHETTILKWNEEKIILNSGGWRTATTKTRMNQASSQFGLGFDVFQKDREWFVKYHGKTYSFDDGMILLVQAVEVLQ